MGSKDFAVKNKRGQVQSSFEKGNFRSSLIF